MPTARRFSCIAALRPRLAAAQPAAPAKITAADAAALVARANAYFNSTTTMVADFVQIGPDGTRTEGKVYVQKPGRLRFQYAAPATLEIIADGKSVAVRDRKLATQDVYFIWQTPLKFLLKSHIDLAHETHVLEVAEDQGATSITVEDSETFGGTSRIRLVFDPTTFALKQWAVTDPQGYQTLVSLFNVNTTAKPDPSLFQINYDTRSDDDNPYK